MFTVALSAALSFARASPFGEYDDSAFAPRTAAAKRHSRILSSATRAVLRAALAPLLFALPVASSEEQPARFSSRHDDECRNVRPEARNSMDRARARDSCAAYSVLGNRPKARVYEISPLSLSLSLSVFLVRVETLDLFALHFARFSSRKSASACRLPARATRCRFPPRRGGGDLHASRAVKARGSLDNSKKNSSLVLGATKRTFETITVNP